MREGYREYLRLTDAEFQTLWREGLFAFDASALLNIYGYSEETSGRLMELLEKLSDRARLPHQFGLEFTRNRPKVIIKQMGNYTRAEEALKKVYNEQLLPRREHPHLSGTALQSFAAIREELAVKRRKLELFLSHDEFLDRILAVFSGRVGAAPSAKQMSSLHTEAKARYSQSIPPGYADVLEKGEPQAFGDYIGWRQLIDIAKIEQNGIIFVCDDTKADWWWIENDRTLGPRPELRMEFFGESGRLFQMYTSDRFLEAARDYLKENVSEEAIAEVKERIKTQRQEGESANQKPIIKIDSDSKSVNPAEQANKISEGADVKSSVIDTFEKPI